MKKVFPAATALLTIGLLAAAAPADAAGIRYYEDPVYHKLAPEDHAPMEDMQILADEGDVRAQYILGDLYAKGKGGYPKNIAKAQEWFETSARNGYPYSYIRLAAQAKRADRPVEAYQWYSLAIKHCSGGDRAWAEKARGELAAQAKLTPEEISAARKNADKWEDAAIEKNRAERAERKRREDALIGPKKPREGDVVEKKTIEKTKTTIKTERYRNGDN